MVAFSNDLSARIFKIEEQFLDMQEKADAGCRTIDDVSKILSYIESCDIIIDNLISEIRQLRIVYEELYNIQLPIPTEIL